MLNRLSLKICICTCLILCMCIFQMESEASTVSSNKGFEVLILHSYNIDYLWTQDQHQSFTKTLEALGINCTYSVELLDTKKYPGIIHNQMFVDVIISKYKKQDYDLIYVTDNDAFNFILKYADVYFPNTPVVASGINGSTDLTQLPPNFHLVLEQPDFQQTITQMLEVQPNIRRVHIVNDQSTTGTIFKKQIESEVIPRYPALEWHWIEDLDYEGMVRYSQNLTQEDGLMLTIYFTDGAKETFTDREIVKLLVRNASIPVWFNWDFHLNTGAIGGHLVRGSKQGERAAQLAFQLLQGNNLQMQSVDTQFLNENIIDYEVLQRFNLHEKDYSFNPNIINKPQSYFQKNRELILIFSGIIGLLLFIIAILARAIHDERQLKFKNQELLQIKQAVILNQKEVVFKMSELIENRSHDTGNHVRRVALISRILAERYGLSEPDILELESAAPMHDVGKIGIPEMILNKPGRLDLDERKIMETHTTLGYQIFQNADLPIFKAASLVSLQHHEHWDGNGYPLGISGEAIHIYGRIVAIADVFDALLSVRVYKPPWTLEETCSFIEKQRGAMFEPKLVSLFFDNLQDLIAVRNQFID